MSTRLTPAAAGPAARLRARWLGVTELEDTASWLEELRFAEASHALSRTAVACGSLHSLFILDDGALYASGNPCERGKSVLSVDAEPGLNSVVWLPHRVLLPAGRRVLEKQAGCYQQGNSFINASVTQVGIRVVHIEQLH